MAISDTGFEGDVDLYKNSRKMMAAMLMRKLQQQNPSLGGNVLNALALGIMGYAEKRDEERGAKGLGDVRKALEDAGVTTPSTTTPSTTTPPTKAESAPTSEPGPRTETPSVMAGKYPAAETGTSRPSTSRMTMPDLTPPAMPTEREPARPMMTAGDAGNFYDRTGALGPTTTPAGMGDMVAPSLDRTIALDPTRMNSQAMMGVSGGEPGNNAALAAALLGQTPRPPEAVSSTQPMPPPDGQPAPQDMLAAVRARAATMGPALGPPPPSRPQATEMDRGPVYPPPPGGEDWGPPNGYRGPGAPLPPAPSAVPAPAGPSPEWQRLQEYQRSQGQPPQPPPPPAMMRPGGALPGPQSMAAPEPSMRQEPGIRAIDQAAPPTRAASNLTDFIAKQEGFRATAYPDYKQTSIGYGTRGQPGETITREEGQRRLESEVANARQSVEKFAPNAPAGVKDALTSLTYNAGPGWQQAGLGRLVSEGRYDEARDRFLQYNKAGGETLPGLVNRRNTELSTLWNAAGGGAPAGQPSAQPAPYQVAQAGGGPPPGPPQTAPQRPGQAVIDQLRRLADTHPDPEVRNRANSIIIQQRLQELQPPEVTWQERGGDKVPFSVDRRTGQIRQVPIAGEEKPKMAAPGQVGVPEPPPGVDPKKWRETMSTEMAKRAMGETIPVEAAGRLAMMQTTQKDFQSTRKELEGGWDATKRAQYLAYRAGQGWAAGDTGRALRNVDVAIESALRAMTGAAAPPAELASYRDKFMPTPFDDEKSRKQKLDLLEDFMGNASKNIMQGRGMQAPDLGVRQSPAEAARAVTGGWSIRRVQ